jgi:hypothetical protein
MLTAFEIWQRLLADGQPSQLPRPWREVPCHPAFFRLAEKDVLQKQVASLLDKHPSAELERAKLLAAASPEHAGDNCPETPLHPCLLAEPEFVLAPRTAANQPVSQLFAGMRRLGSGGGQLGLPLSDFRAPRERHRLDHKHHLFVAFSMADLACLWSLGLPALPARSLATAKASALRELAVRWQKVGAKSVSSGDGIEDERVGEGLLTGSSEASEASIALVLVDVNLSLLNANHPPLLEDVEKHLQRMSECCDVNLADVSVWHPPARDLGDLEWTLLYGSKEDAAHLILESVDMHARRLGHASSASATAAIAEVLPSYAQAMREVYQAQQQSLDKRQLERRRQRLLDAYHREIVEPLLQQARDEKDPIRKADLHALALACRDLHRYQWPPEDNVYRADCTAAQLAPAAAAEILRLERQITTLIERIRQCPSLTSSAPASPVPVPGAPVPTGDVWSRRMPSVQRLPTAGRPATARQSSSRPSASERMK